MKVVLTCPPVIQPDWPTLGVETIASITRQEGHDAFCYYAAMLPDVKLNLDTPGGAAFFSPGYFGTDPAVFAADLRSGILDDCSRDPVVVANQRAWGTGSTRLGNSLDAWIAEGLPAAERAVQDACSDVLALAPDIVGFSIAVDDQKMPSAAIAKALREAGFQGPIIAGGTAVDGEMGEAFLEVFEEFDIVIRGECDESWRVLLDVLDLESRTLREPVAGAVWRGKNGFEIGPRDEPSHTFTTGPLPDYEQFQAQLSASSHVVERQYLAIETSRSCWWGEKHHCLFCAVNSEDRPYRQKTNERIIADICEVWDRYQPDTLFLTDSILPYSQRGQLLRALRAENDKRDWCLFYEIKSTLSRDVIAQLRAAGVRDVQPGVESFSTASLKRMSKGATFLQQVNLVKWCTAFGISAFYPIIVGIPGETADDLRAYTSVMPRMRHLNPPSGVNRLLLYKGSPYYLQRDKYGFQDVKALAIDRVGYPIEPALRSKLTFQFAYRLDAQLEPDYLDAVTDLVRTVEEWRNVHRVLALTYLDGPLGFVVQSSDTSTREQTTHVVRDRVQVAVLRASHEVARLPRIASELGVSLDKLDRAVAELEQAGWLVRDGHSVLNLLLPLGKTYLDFTSDN